jgi:hypothetical protein
MTLKTSYLETVLLVGTTNSQVAVSYLETVFIFNTTGYSGGGNPIDNGPGGTPVDPGPGPGGTTKKRRIVTLSTGYFPHV